MKSYIRCLALTVTALVGVSAVGQAVENKSAPASQPTTMTVTKSGTSTVTVTTTAVSPRTVGMGDLTFTVTPADEPKPALKYQFFPPRVDRMPGNAVLMIDQAIQMAPSGERGDKWKSKYSERIGELLDVPLEQIRRSPAVQQEIQDIVGAYGSSLNYMELAAYRRDADWGLPYEKGIAMFMPSLSPLRQEAKVLALKAGLETAQGKYDQAIKTLETGYSVAEQTGGATLINSLVGVAMEALLNYQVMTMVQQPGCPNLYWALASLPPSIGKMEQGMQLEPAYLYMQFPELKDYKKLTPEQWRVMVHKIEDMMRQCMGQDLPKLASVAMVASNVGPAKEYLAENGYTPEQIKKMTPSQIVGLYFMDEWNYWWDETNKWGMLPFGKGQEGAARANKAMEERMASHPGSLVSILMPGLSKARTLQARVDRGVASLMAVEAIRMYAARHEGKPPATLADLNTLAPAPDDPMTGKPFEYKADGQTFVLRGVLIPGGQAGRDEFKYTVTIVPQAKGASNAK